MYCSKVILTIISSELFFIKTLERKQKIRIFTCTLSYLKNVDCNVQAGIYSFKVNSEHTSTMYEISSNLTIYTPDRCQ